MDQDRLPTAEDLVAAHDRIKPYIHHTPHMRCATISEIVGADVVFKCENFQRIGAFKIRGATNALRAMPREALQGGACTHSSGNHAQAVAYAARALGVPAHIVMPENAPQVKKAAVAGYGAHIYYCKPTQAEREATANAVMERTGAAFLHPYDDYRIIAGQGTAAMELLAAEGPLDYLLAPVGGGGLISGTALAATYFAPGTQVWACEPDGANDAYRSWVSGVRHPSESPRTLADGLLTSVGERNWGVMRAHLRGVVTCSEASIVQAMRLLWERMKVVVEPSSAVPLACLLEGKLPVAGHRVGIILSGGNVDLGNLPFGAAQP